MRTLLLSILAVGCVALAPAAAAQAKCDDLFTASRGMADAVSTAFTAIKEKDAAKQKAALPAVEAVVKTLPAAEIKAELCNGNHVNAYTSHQYAELSVLRERNLDTGFPKDLPIVKQPELNQGLAAYAAGWIKYEMGDFTGALDIYAKGLAMFPYSASLQNEYAATLMQLKRYKDLVTFADKVLDKGFDLSDTDRSKIYVARGYGLLYDGDKAGAKEAVNVAILYDNTDGAQTLLKLIDAS